MNQNPMVDAREQSEILIVFVYLGSHLPKYFIKNVERTAIEFPRAAVVLATDRAVNKRIMGAKHIELTKDILRTGGGVGFRNGFWSKSMDRLVALESIHDMFPSHHLVHLEGDVRLSPTFNFQILPKEKLSWGSVTKNEDGAALLSSPTLTSTRFLASSLIEARQKDASATDMKTLFEIRREYPGLVDLLPSLGESTDSVIIDFASFGMWLGGTDPRNSRGVSHFRKIQASHLARPQSFEYRLIENRLMAAPKEWTTSRNESCELIAMHLHAKNPRYFSLPWPSLASELLSNKRRWSFSVQAFLLWCRDRIGEYFRAAKSVGRRFRLLIHA